MLQQLRQLEGEHRHQHDCQAGEDHFLAPLGGVGRRRVAAVCACVDSTHQGVPPAATAELEVEESGVAAGVAAGAAAADPLYVKTFRWIVAASCGS